MRLKEDLTDLFLTQTQSKWHQKSLINFFVEISILMSMNGENQQITEVPTVKVIKLLAGFGIALHHLIKKI